MNLAKITRTCESILHKRLTDSTGIIPDPRIYVGFIFDPIFCRSLFFAVFVFDSCFPRLWKFFVTLGIATFFTRNLHIFLVLLTIYYARFSGSFVFFLSKTCQKIWLLIKEDILSWIFPLHELFNVFFVLNRPPAESRMSNFGKLNLILSPKNW